MREMSEGDAAGTTWAGLGWAGLGRRGTAWAGLVCDSDGDE